MVDEARLPADPAQLQERLWAQADVLPGLSETLLQLAKTQETGVSDLGFVAKGPIAKGDVIISVPMRFALVVNMKSGAKGDELPSDVRLALQLLATAFGIGCAVLCRQSTLFDGFDGFTT